MTFTVISFLAGIGFAFIKMDHKQFKNLRISKAIPAFTYFQNGYSGLIFRLHAVYPNTSLYKIRQRAL
jgi:hypothetical protein